VKVAIGLLISHGFPVPAEFMQSYQRVWSRLITGQCNAGLPPHLTIQDVKELRQTSFPVDFARNEICRSFLTTDADALLFLDADQTFPEDVVERLVRAEKPVITGRYHMRKPPFHPTVYVKHRLHTGKHAFSTVHFGKGVFEIERGGAGCLLIQRGVIEAIDRMHKDRWADFLASDACRACPEWMREQFPLGPVTQWFKYQHSAEPPYDYGVSEDFWFYRQAREAGYSCWCDWDCECGHLQQFTLDRAWNATYLDKQIAELNTVPPDEREKVVNSLVVCGYPDGLTLPTGDHLPPYTVGPGER
jgi:hypothetical protein